MKKNILLLVAAIGCGQISFSQQSENNSESGVITCSYFGVSQPLRNFFGSETKMNSFARPERNDREHRQAQQFVYTAADGPEYGNDISTIQKNNGTRMPVSILQNWEGQQGVCPPDPTGAAGMTYYVQSVNATPFKIFNKTTGAQVGSVNNIGALWTPAIFDLGDPIVLYDKYADRWVLSELSSSFTHVYIAVSTTNDPTGTYYTYTFTSPASIDYPKFSVWADGYYMTYNSGGGTNRVFCFERNQMILGNASSRAIYKSFTAGPNSGFYAPLPADADGVLPPFGTPCPFFSYSENSWGTGAIDGVKIWTMSVNWVPATPTATITGPTVLATAAFDGTYDSNWNDITQPGTSQKLDGIGGVCIFRSQWRQWAGYNTVVLSWGVKLSTTQKIGRAHV